MTLSRRRLLSKSSLALAGLTLSGYAAGQSTETDVGTTAAPGTATPAGGTDAAVDRLSDAIAAFGTDLHHQLVAANEGENVLASPYSAAVALAMSYAGARGETATEMADALRFPFGQERLHPTVGELSARVDPPADGDGTATPTAGDDEVPFTLETANALWGQADYPFAPSFVDLLNANYGAGMRTVDYADEPEAARQRINEWVAEQTQDTIPELLPSQAITRLTRIVLTNAVYFKANWRHTFLDSATRAAPFTRLDGSTATVQMMRLAEPQYFPYAEIDGTQVVALPYEGGDADMVIVLPPEGEYAAVESELDGPTLRSYFDALEETEGYVSLPRFEFDFGGSIAQALRNLGMERAFDPARANLQGMIAEDADESLSITEVVQKTFIAVDEDGTEASAATAVVGGDESAPSPEYDLVADRPFLFAIRHRPTDAALFLGRVVDLEDQATGTETTRSPSTPEPVGPNAEPPADPDQDGLFEDVNGNDRQDIADAVDLFQHREAVDPQHFDFNDSGGVDIGDAVALFQENT